MKLRTLKCLTLIGFGFGLAAGCGGSPADGSLLESAPLNEEGNVTQACPINGCTDDGDSGYRSLKLKCYANYPFVGLEITNTSTTTNVPADAVISYRATFLYSSNVITGSFSGPLAKGQTKVVWPGLTGSSYPEFCSALAEWNLW